MEKQRSEQLCTISLQHQKQILEVDGAVLSTQSRYFFNWKEARNKDVSSGMDSSDKFDKVSALNDSGVEPDNVYPRVRFDRDWLHK